MLVSLSEFENLNEKEKKKVLRQMKSEVGVSGIVEAWGVSRSKVYSMLHDFNVPLDPRKPRKADESKKDQDESWEASDVGSDGDKRAEFRLELEENPSPFSLHLETRGNLAAISETVQLLLGSGKLAKTNLHLNLTITEV